MKINSLPEETLASAPTTPRYRAAIWTLLILSPFIAEVLSGSTRMSFIFVLIPEVMVWGVGALLCRELVRRWHAGVTSLLLLGLALSIAEEFVIQQTSLAPLPWPGSNAGYSRMWGVNWVYFLFMLGFESVWVVLIPVQVTELLFRSHREEPWLRKRGFIASCGIFVFGSFIAWYSWTQQALPKKLHVPPYRPPLFTITLGLAAIVLLVGASFMLRGFGLRKRGRNVAPAWLAGLIAFAMGAAWFKLIALMFVPHPIQPVWIPIAAGIGWCLVAFALFQRWSSAEGWSDIHRWSVSFGATIACMVTPYLSLAGWSRVDLIGIVILDVFALGGFLVLARMVFNRGGAENLQADRSE